jgi:phospholipid/cholesterol/gamma-HCH transport system substrate-binding protein
MDSKGLEVKVGLVALGAIALLVVFVVALGGFSFGKHHTLYITYNFAGGLESGAQVKIAGFRAGKVRAVDFIDGEFDPASKKPVYIKATIEIEDKLWKTMREGSEFYINTQGLIGEQYLEIVPGPVGSPQIAEGQTIRGKDPVRTDLLMTKVYGLLEIASGLFESGQGAEVAESLRVFLKSAGDLMGILSKSLEGREKEIGELIPQVNALIEEATRVANAAANGLGDGTQVKELFADVQTLVNEGNRAATKVEKLLDTADAYLEPTLAEAKAALAEVRTATKVLSELKLDPEQIKGAVSDLTKAASRLESITNDAQGIVKEIKTGDNTVALLLRDAEIYDDLKEMLRDLKLNPWKFLWKE